MANSPYSSLQPNATYHGPHGSTEYHTDAYGRVTDWSGQCVDIKEARNQYAQRTLEGKSSEFRDASHLMDRCSGGSGEKYNMVPMHEKLNERDYKAFERENHQLMEAGNTVTLHGSNSYLFSTEGLNVPDGIMVTREVHDPNGALIEVSHHSWSNYDPAEFEAAGLEESAALMNEFENPNAFVYNGDENLAANETTNEVVNLSLPETDAAETPNEGEAPGMEDMGGGLNDDGGIADTDSGLTYDAGFAADDSFADVDGGPACDDSFADTNGGPDIADADDGLSDSDSLSI